MYSHLYKVKFISSITCVDQAQPQYYYNYIIITAPLQEGEARVTTH